MKTLKSFYPRAMFTVALLVPGLQAVADEDPVRAGFDRMFAHQPVTTVAGDRGSIENDRLYQLFNAKFWTRDGVLSPLPPEFDRLLKDDYKVRLLAVNDVEKMYLYDYPDTGAADSRGDKK